MRTRQLRILYRDFLFRVVDRDLLSTHAKGDASQLLLQILTLLVFVSIGCSILALLLDFGGSAPVRVIYVWSIQHFLIATTMLVVGIFSVLSWGAIFPSHRDVLILGPLPVRPHTILLARVGAVTTALGLTVLALHLVAGVVWPLTLNATARSHYMLALTSDRALPPAPAADLQAVLDRDFAAVLRTGPLAPHVGGGVSIGISQRGVRRVMTYGAASPDSIFAIGSVTKPFTGLLLAKMAEEGVTNLHEPVRQLIPEFRVPQPPGDEITLVDLATHRSGLPRMPMNYRPADPANPYADFHVGRLQTYLGSRGVERPPAPPFVYSNLGYGLLGYALANRAGVDYATLVRHAITEPLGMRDTSAALTAEPQRRFLQGYNDERQPVPPWDLGMLTGAGGLRSTAPDLLTWLEANLHPENVTDPWLARALRLSHERQASVGSGGGIALGWMLEPNSGGVSHGGAMAGFTAHASFNRREDVALVVLSNLGPATVASADVVAAHVRSRLDGTPPVALAELQIPATGGLRRGIQLFVAYWLTMMAAGVFVFALMIATQGVAVSLLPRGMFLRVSSFLQLAAFGGLVAAYFLQSFIVTPDAVVEAEQRGVLGAQPSLWFLGLFQALSGSPALAPLANRAYTGLALVIAGAVVAFGASYVRSVRRIADEPDIVPTSGRFRWLPPFGGSLPTALVQFSLRTLFRSPPHRLILAFYWGMGFALTAVFVKTPRRQQVAATEVASSWQNAWQEETGLAVIISSLVMIGFTVLAARLAFAMPRDLAANWIFRIVPVRGGHMYLAARRRALIMVSLLPVWAVAAAASLWIWPWQPAIGHLIALAMLGMILVEFALSGTQKIPFTCSYLPGRSRAHVTFYVTAVLLLPLAVVAARFERDALQDSMLYGVVLGSLAIVWVGIRWLAARSASASAGLEFEDEPADRVLTLDVWDSRFASTSKPPPTHR